MCAPRRVESVAVADVEGKDRFGNVQTGLFTDFADRSVQFALPGERGAGDWLPEPSQTWVAMKHQEQFRRWTAPEQLHRNVTRHAMHRPIVIVCVACWRTDRRA